MADVRSALAIITAWAAFAGCKVTETFTCETSDQCRASTGQGMCEAATGFCTFADADCPSGMRYADNAGGGVAGDCTGGPPLPDAAIDAPVFDTTPCPAKFDITLTSVPNAKFFLDLGGGTYAVGANRCLAELPGATHPANVHSAAAVAEIGPLLNGGGVAWIYVGVIQEQTATMPNAGWYNFDGTMFDATLWSVANPVQPDDGDGSEANHAQQVGAVLTAGGVGDYPANSSVPLLCACDGVPVDPRILALL